MSSFTIGPFPCRNPSSFSKYPIKKDVEKKSSDKMPIVHRNVEGENDGECYKIKGPKTPFLLRHLEKHFMEKPEEEQREKKDKQESTSGTKRERSESDSDEDFDDPNVPSTSSSSKKKKRLEQQSHR